MYDLIISQKQINRKKIIALIVLVTIMVVIATILGVKRADKKKSKMYANELQQEQESIENQEEQTKNEEEAKRQEEIKERLNKVNEPLNEQTMNNILHIYNSNGIKRVFLTFDDGPTKAVTPFILDILKEKKVQATFFVLGTNASKNSELLNREYDEGHYIANHGYSHKYTEIYSSTDATLNEFNQTQQIIRDALGNQSYLCKVFRFPGGSTGGKYNTQKQGAKDCLVQNGIAYLDWNALSEDAAGQYTKEQLLENTKNTIGNKESVVILMHDSADKILTYEMLPDLIDYLKQQGYTFENIYNLLD